MNPTRRSFGTTPPTDKFVPSVASGRRFAAPPMGEPAGRVPTDAIKTKKPLASRTADEGLLLQCTPPDLNREPTD